MIVCPYNLNIIYLDIFYGIKLLCSILFQKPLKYRIAIARKIRKIGILQFVRIRLFNVENQLQAYKTFKTYNVLFFLPN